MPRLRAILLAALLFAEGLAFSLAFDLQPLQTNPFPLLGLAGHATAVFRIVAVTLVVLLVMGRKSLPDLLPKWREAARHDRTFVWMLAAHFAAAISFVLLARQVL